MSLENVIFRAITRYMAGRYTERHGTITSYDPKTYRAKCIIYPEGFESGWCDIEAEHAGVFTGKDGKKYPYGILAGPATSSRETTANSNTGSTSPSPAGQTNNNNPGDQVIVRFQEGDFEAGKIVKRLFSNKRPPPEVKSGEILVQHVSQNKLFFDEKKQIQEIHYSGGSEIWDKTGNWTLITNKLVMTIQDHPDIKQAASLIFDGKSNIALTAAGDPQVPNSGVIAMGAANSISATAGTTMTLISGQAMTVYAGGAMTVETNSQPLTITDNQGATIAFDGAGNISITAKSVKINSTAGTVDINQ